MALTLGDNFSYQGAKPLDARLKYDTLASMKAVADATMYDGCMAYCVATDKTYQWKSTNTVDADTGKWREFSSGGGAEYTADEGINIDENNNITTDKSESGDMDEIVDELPVGSVQVVAGFTPIGTIIPLMGNHAPTHYLICNGQVVNITEYPELANYFEREFGTKNHFGGNGTTTFAVPDLRGEFLRGTGTNSHEKCGNGANVGTHQDATRTKFFSMNGTNLRFSDTVDGTGAADSTSGAVSTNYVDIAFSAKTGTYTNWITSRPTNTSVLFCIATKDIYMDARNDYSTDEKVVGKWIDGSAVYQRTFYFETAISVANDTWVEVSSIDCATLGIKTLIDFNGIDIGNANTGHSSIVLFSANYDPSVSTKLRLFNVREKPVNLKVITLQYIKNE